MCNQEKSILFDIVTLDNLYKNPEKILSIIENIMNNFILPLNHSLFIQLENTHLNKVKDLKFTERNWARIKNNILNSELVCLYIINHTGDAFKTPKVTFSIQFNLEADYWNALASKETGQPIMNSIGLSIAESNFNGNIPRDFEYKFENLFKSIFKEINGICGYISLKYGTRYFTPSLSSLELYSNEYHKADYCELSYKFKENFRGYFWGNIISEEHIKRLGGIDNVVSKCPCYKIEKINFNDRICLYICLTPDINNYSDDELRALKSFFKPIIPTENIEYITEQTNFIRKNTPFKNFDVLKDFRLVIE